MATEDTTPETVEQFLLALDKFHPTIPESVTEYHLRKSGFHTTDPRVVKTVSLAAQKFMADIAYDALQQCKARNSKARKDSKLVLTTQDLQAALKLYGVNVMKTDGLGSAPAPAAAAGGVDGAAAGAAVGDGA